MPNKPGVSCKFPGCPAVIPVGERYCDEHKKRVSKDYEKTRETAVQRGYTKRWQKIRAMKLAKDPMCECDECKGQRLLADTVHHIDRNPRNNRDENLLSMHHDCHNCEHARHGERWGGEVRS